MKVMQFVYLLLCESRETPNGRPCNHKVNPATGTCAAGHVQNTHDNKDQPLLTAEQWLEMGGDGAQGIIDIIGHAHRKN